MDLVSLLAGAGIGAVSSLLTLITAHALQRRLQDRQWSREDALRREQQARDDIKPLITMPNLTKGGQHVLVPDGKLYCFPPDTRITLVDGQTRPVQDVLVGDILLSYDALKRQQASTTVTKIVKDRSDVLIALNGTLCTTRSHRIVRADGLPVPAAELTVGSNLLSQAGDDVELVKIELLRQESDVYNLETEGRHNFFANGLLTGDYFSKTHTADDVDDALSSKKREIRKRLMEGTPVHISPSGEIGGPDN